MAESKISTTTENNKRIAKNSIYMSIRMVIVLLISLYTTRCVLDVLGVQDYGIYNVVAGFVTMFGFLNTSLSNGIQRFFNYELGKNGIEGANRVYNMALLIQIILAIVILLPTEIIGTWYLHHKMVIPIERMFAAECIFQMALLTFLFHILQVPYTAAVMAHERMSFYAIISVLNAVVTLGAIFVMTDINGDYLIIYGVILAIIALFTFISYVLYTKRQFQEIYIRLRFHKPLFKEMLSFSGWNIFGTFGQMLKDQGVNLILNFFFGPIVNAARGVANQINGGMQSFVSNITIPVRPQIVQSYSKGDIFRSLHLTYTISKFSCYVLLIISLPILLNLDFVLHIWLGDNIPTHTISFVVIVVLNSFLNNLSSAISGLVHASGKMKRYQLAGGTISIISVIVVFIAMIFSSIPELALIVVLLMDTIRQIIALAILKSLVTEFSLRRYLNEVIMSLIAVASLAILLPMFVNNQMQEGVLRFTIVFTLSILTVGTSIYFVGLNSIEKNSVKQLLVNFRNKIIRRKL